MGLKRIRLLRHIFLTLTLFFLMSASFFLGIFLPVYAQNHSYKLISSQGTVNYEVPTPPSSPEKFLSVFHTGSCLWDVYHPDRKSEYAVWTPAREAGVIKWGLATQNVPGYGNKDYLSENGDISGYHTNSKILSYIQKYFALDIVPVLEINFENFETASRNAFRNWLINLGNWVDSVDSSKFVVWSPGAECNFPDSDVNGWAGYKIDWRYYNPQMAVIRDVRDELNLQDKVLIAAHANLHTSYYVTATGKWVTQDWYTGFVGIQEYLEGYAQCDIMGFSHYHANKNPAYNLGGISWQEDLYRTWRRTEIISEMVNNLAGKTLPTLFLEFSVGNCWKYDPVWKAAITYVYTQMVPNNLWCKGLNWYVGTYIDSDAMQELVKLSSKYNGYS